MKQIPFPFARAAWFGQRPISREELRERKRRVDQRARELHLASLSPAERARERQEEELQEECDSRQMVLPFQE